MKDKQDKHTGKQKDMQIDRYTGSVSSERQTVTQTDRQIERQSERQTDRDTD